MQVSRLTEEACGLRSPSRPCARPMPRGWPASRGERSRSGRHWSQASENPWVESYGSRMRDELLAIEQFDTLLEAQVLFADWRTEYNNYRPPLRPRHAHSSRVRGPVEAHQATQALIAGGPINGVRSAALPDSGVLRRDVLRKYYDDDRYSVTDGYIRHAYLWDLRVDNNTADNIVVFLGDLGRDLPHAEQMYWRSFNIQPEGSMSETNFRRSFLGEFADPERVEFRFRSAYEVPNDAWEQRFGWRLYRGPGADDRHIIEGLHVPITDGSRSSTVRSFRSPSLSSTP
jgi:hypothetical protein